MLFNVFLSYDKSRRTIKLNRTTQENGRTNATVVKIRVNIRGKNTVKPVT